MSSLEGRPYCRVGFGLLFQEKFAIRDLVHKANTLCTLTLRVARNGCLELETLGELPCPLPNQVCAAAPGSYSCDCAAGYVLSAMEEEGCKSVAITNIENTVRLHVHIVNLCNQATSLLHPAYWVTAVEIDSHLSRAACLLGHNIL